MYVPFCWRKLQSGCTFFNIKLVYGHTCVCVYAYAARTFEKAYGIRCVWLAFRRFLVHILFQIFWFRRWLSSGFLSCVVW